MHQAKEYLARTGWLIAIPSALSLAMAIALLAAPLPEFGWQLSMYEAVGGTLALLSMFGLICGVGLLKRKKLARIPSLVWLSLGAVFWVISVLRFAVASIDSPGEFLAEVVDAPLTSVATVLLSIAMAAWFLHTIYMLSRAKVKNAFDA